MHAHGPGEHVLDLETLSLSWERAGMRVSCCVVHDVSAQRDLVFSAEPVPGAVPGTRPLDALYWFLEACRSEGCTLVGHNIRSFDWEVLAAEFEARGLVADRRAWGPGRARLVDTLATLHATLGWRPSLQSLAWHNLGEGKSMDGAEAPGLWRQGLRKEVIAYCRRDVDLTRRVWLKGRQDGRITVDHLPDGSAVDVPVQW